MIWEWACRRSLLSLFYDVPSYNYVWIIVFGASFGAGMMARHAWFNPDVYIRRQELVKPLPDRLRQFSYSGAYYNGFARNVANAYKASYIDNEPDLTNYHPLGIRPNRKLAHKRLPAMNYSIPMYFEQDPHYTGALHSNISKMYKQIGYSKL
jgi:hypothetical protein